MTLHISPDFYLPDESITETFCILAKKRVGKSNAAVVMAEEMHNAGLPWVAIDPKGDWWGMRSNGAGDGPGLAILVLGGEHGDLPLPPTSGEVIADLIAEQHITCILDVSDMTGADQRRFLTAFANRLYRKNREPLHVFCEEANVYIPQVVRGEDATMVGAFERLVKQGGFHGIGTTLITQRSASLNKNVLTQTETMIAMRTTAPQDKKVIKEWLDEHDAAPAVMSEISSLDNGEAWVISPHFLETVEKIKFRRRGTFDSGATPKIGEKRIVPKDLAELDLDALKTMMADTVEQIEGNDPKALKTEVAQLRKENDILSRASESREERVRGLVAEVERLKAVQVESVEVPVLNDDDRHWLTKMGETLDANKAVVYDILDRFPAGTEPMSAVRTISDKFKIPRDMFVEPDLTPPKIVAMDLRDSPTDSEPVALSKAERTILTVLVQYLGAINMPMSVSGVALRAGYAAGGGGFRNALSSLRTKGYIEGKDPISLTINGMIAVGDVEPLPTGWALVEQQLVNPALKMGKAHRLIMEFLWETRQASTDVIADETGYEPTGGGFRNALSRLRSTNLIVTENNLSSIHSDLRTP